VSSRNVLIPEAMPDWLVHYPPLVERVAATRVFSKSQHQKPNHCVSFRYWSRQSARTQLTRLASPLLVDLPS
jgi:hypothetical protein